jgi:hypothetical protein
MIEKYSLKEFNNEFIVVDFLKEVRDNKAVFVDAEILVVRSVLLLISH